MASSIPYTVFDPSKERLRNNNQCHSDFVNINMVKMVGSGGDLKKYLAADEDERDNLLNKNGKILQHLLVLDVPACDILTSTNLMRSAEIQEGTHFRNYVKKGISYMTMYKQVSPPPGYGPSGKLKDRFERTILPKYTYREDEGENTVFSNLTEDRLLKLNMPKKRYFSFRIMFEDTFELPDPQSWLIICQVHQAGGDAPPLGVRVKTGSDPMGPIRLNFSIRQSREEDDATGVKDIELIGEIINQVTGERNGLLVKRGVMYKLTFELKPTSKLLNGRLQAPGPLRIWVSENNGPDQLIYSNKIHWGYPMFLNKKTNELNLDSDRMSIKIGMYRRRHNRLHSIRLGVAKYGPTLSSVA